MSGLANFANNVFDERNVSSVVSAEENLGEKWAAIIYDKGLDQYFDLTKAGFFGGGFILYSRKENKVLDTGNIKKDLEGVLVENFILR